MIYVHVDQVKSINNVVENNLGKEDKNGKRNKEKKE